MDLQPPPAFWSIPTGDLLKQLETTSQGLGEDEAKARLRLYGANLLKPRKRTDALTLLLSQFKSPIILILLLAAALSIFLAGYTDAIIIMAIVVISGLLGFWQERGAARAVEELLAVVQVKGMVQRQGKALEVPVEEIVPGDVVLLNAGDAIPADCHVLESKDLFVDEAALTGETFPVEKAAGVLPAETPLSQRTNTLLASRGWSDKTRRARFIPLCFRLLISC